MERTTQQITFKELYRRQKEKKTPAQHFIEEVATVTMRSPATVRMWLQGKQTPDALTKEVLAQHFRCDADALFGAAAESATSD